MGKFEPARNKKAYFDYEILDSLEVGIMLLGEEVKSIRNGGLNFTGSYILSKGNALYLVGTNIARYKSSSNPDYDAVRDRKLLLKKQELEKIRTSLSTKGTTLVPLEGYFHHGLFKLKVGLARGKKKYDKREAIKEREITRELRKRKIY